MRSASAVPMPASGSSSNSTRGPVASVIAISSWRCSPWLMVPAIGIAALRKTGQLQRPGCPLVAGREPGARA